MGKFLSERVIPRERKAQQLKRVVCIFLEVPEQIALENYGGKKEAHYLDTLLIYHYHYFLIIIYYLVNVSDYLSFLHSVDTFNWRLFSWRNKKILTRKYQEIVGGTTIEQKKKFNKNKLFALNKIKT